MLIFSPQTWFLLSDGDPHGFAHTRCPWGRVFTPLSCPGVCLGVSNENKCSTILRKV